MMLHMCFHVLAKQCVDRGLISLALAPEKGQHFAVKSQRDKFLWTGPANCSFKEASIQLWAVGIVDVFIFHSVNAIPLRPGWFFHKLFAPSCLLSSMK